LDAFDLGLSGNEYLCSNHPKNRSFSGIQPIVIDCRFHIHPPKLNDLVLSSLIGSIPHILLAIDASLRFFPKDHGSNFTELTIKSALDSKDFGMDQTPPGNPSITIDAIHFGGPLCWHFDI